MKPGGDTQTSPSPDTQAAPGPCGPWWWDALGLLIAAAGGFLCIEAYLGQHSLFVDEMRLLESVINRGFGQLTEPLAQEQAAPVGFLFLLKLSMEWIGEDKLGFRAVPMAAAVGSMFLFWLLIRQLVTGWPAWFGMAVFASGSWLTYFAQQTKQYTLELAVSLTLFCLLAWIARRGLRGWRLVIFALAGAAATWFAVTAVIVLAGCGVVLLVLAIRQRNKAMIAAVVGVGVVWVGSFLAQYALVLSAYRESDYLATFWEDFYLQINPRLPHRLFGQLAIVFDRPVDLPMFQLGFGVWALGLYAAVRSRRALPWALVGAWAVLAAMSFAGQYPYGQRQVLFALPIFIGLMAMGLAWLRTLGRAGEGMALALGALLASGTLLTAGNVEADNDLEPVMLELRQRVQPGDIVWVDRGAMYSVGFLQSISDEFDLAPATIQYTTLVDGQRHWALADLQSLQGKPRVWLLMTHSIGRGGLNEITFVQMLAKQMGQPREQIQHGDAFATLFDFTAEPSPPPIPAGPQADVNDLPIEFDKPATPPTPTPPIGEINPPPPIETKVPEPQTPVSP